MLKLVLNTFLSATLILSGAASKALASTENHEQFRLDFESISDVKAIEVETLTVGSAQEAAEKVDQLLSRDNERTIVSSAHVEVLETATHYPKRVALLPVAEAVNFAKDKVKGVNELLRMARQNVINAAKKDKIGLGIVTYRVGRDVIRWIHADDLSTFAKTTGVLYLVLSAALVATDKESWPKVVRPIEEKWRKLLKYSENAEERTMGQRISLSYLSNATATTLINLGFIPILAIDRINAGNAASMVTPVIMGLITTASTFSWFEFLRAIDEHEQPRARAISKFLLNTRTVLIASFASTVMLLNAHAYGATPWIYLTVSGVVGLPLMLKANKIADWLERSPTINKVAKLYSSANSFLKRKQIVNSTAAQLMVCQDAFVRVSTP